MDAPESEQIQSFDVSLSIADLPPRPEGCGIRLAGRPDGADAFAFDQHHAVLDGDTEEGDEPDARGNGKRKSGQSERENAPGSGNRHIQGGLYFGKGTGMIHVIMGHENIFWMRVL